MTRRQVLQGLAVLLGGTVSSPVVAAALSERRPVKTIGAWQPRTLTEEQDRLVTAIAELILPATETPGATAARVNEFVDLLLSDWLDAEERDRFLAGLADLEDRCRSRFERPFLELSAAEQLELLAPLDAEAAALRQAAARAGREVDELPFFGMMKEMTLVGYYTSEIGMRQELKYLENPGSYSGCVPLDEIGRAWA